MGASAERVRLWTDEEVATLRRLYPVHGRDWAGWDEELPGRSRAAIVSKASGLGVRRTPVGCDWDGGELRRLMGWIRGMANDLGREPVECVRAAMTLMTVWEEGSGKRRGRGAALADRERRELLSELRGGVSLGALAARYGVAVRTIRRWADDAQAREALGAL